MKPQPSNRAQPDRSAEVRPGVEDLCARRGLLAGWSWLPRAEVAFGLAVGLLLSAVLVGVLPSARVHMFGGTEERQTTVIGVRERPHDGDSGRVVTEYVLRWTENGNASSTEFARSGPPRREVGDTWELWVSPDGATVTDSSPLATWLWLGVGIPAFSLLMGLLWQWRQRVLSRSLLREVDAHARRGR